MAVAAYHLKSVREIVTVAGIYLVSVVLGKPMAKYMSTKLDVCLEILQAGQVRDTRSGLIL